VVWVGGRLLTCFRNRYRINAELGESNSVVSLEFRVDTHFLYHVRVWEVRERQTDREQVQKQGRLDSWGLWSRRRFFLRCDKGWAGWPLKEHAWLCNLIEYNPSIAITSGYTCTHELFISTLAITGTTYCGISLQTRYTSTTSCQRWSQQWMSWYRPIFW